MADIKIKRRILSACQTNCYYVFRDGTSFLLERVNSMPIISHGSNRVNR